jgi:hypothetical protein
VSSPLQPIPTTYLGYRFRSRLEARWAVFFDALSIQFDYEPEGFRLRDGTCYLPDFWLPQANIWAEVKPNDCRERFVFKPDWVRKAAQLAVESDHAVIMLDGPPRATNYWAIWPDQMEPVGWDWDDLYIAEGWYHETGRLYACTGPSFPDHAVEGAIFGDALPPAVLASRAARFERGA